MWTHVDERRVLSTSSPPCPQPRPRRWWKAIFPSTTYPRPIQACPPRCPHERWIPPRHYPHDLSTIHPTYPQGYPPGWEKARRSCRRPDVCIRPGVLHNPASCPHFSGGYPRLSARHPGCPHAPQIACRSHFRWNAAAFGRYPHKMWISRRNVDNSNSALSCGGRSKRAGRADRQASVVSLIHRQECGPQSPARQAEPRTHTAGWSDDWPERHV